MFGRLNGYSVALKRLWRRNLLFYMTTNLLFNSLVPYFQFEDPKAVYLFSGPMCWARFLLPMALLVPFIITIDILKKTLEFYERGKEGITIPASFSKNRFMLRTAGSNALMTLIPVSLLMYCLPADRTYAGGILAAFTGILASALAGFFTWQPLIKLNKCLKGLSQY